MDRIDESKEFFRKKITEIRKNSNTSSPLPFKHTKTLTPEQNHLSLIINQRRNTDTTHLKNLSRSKVLTDVSSESILRPNRFNLNQERIKRLYINPNNSKPANFSSCQDLPRRSKISNISGTTSLLLRLEDTDRSKNESINSFKQILPNWLINRTDFYSTYIKMKQHVGLDLENICSQLPGQRTEDEKEALFKWVSSTKFFSNIPKVIVQETCEKFTILTFNANQQSNFYTVIKKDDVADCMYLIYMGSVGIYVDGIRVGQRSQGESLGETALDNVKLRSADVFADTNLTLFRLKKTDYETIILNLKKLEKYEYTKFLMTIPYFQRWSFIKVQDLSNLLIQSYYKPGDVIYEKNDQSKTFYIIKEGLVQLQTYTNLEQQNKWPIGFRQWKLRKVTNKFIYPVKDLQKGEFFGENEIMHNIQRETRAIAIENTVCLVLNKSEFFEMFNSRELEYLKQKYEIKMPTKQEMEDKIKNEVYSNGEKEQILLDAMKIANGLEGGRDFLLDSVIFT